MLFRIRLIMNINSTTNVSGKGKIPLFFDFLICRNGTLDPDWFVVQEATITK